MDKKNHRHCARFTISFDCEGKWGVADQGERTLGYIKGNDLRDAYRRILILLQRYEVPATFGIVSALCLAPHELKDHIEAIPSLTYCGQDWLLPIRRDIRSNRYDGWAHPEILEMLASESRHELCSHGGFHVPYDELNTPEDSVRADLALVAEVKQKMQVTLQNIILPRNIIGYKELLRLAGFEGYRDIDVREANIGFVNRLKRLSHEFISGDIEDMLPCGDAGNYDAPFPLSPAKFLNARIGIRNIVPNDVTLWRVRKFIDYAISSDLRVHFYTHPHNFIRDKGMFYKFEKLLSLISRQRDAGVLNIITMKEELEERYGILN